MKLATLRASRPDGQLVVVSHDLARCVSAGRIVPSLQAALDDWDRVAPALAVVVVVHRELLTTVNVQGRAAGPAASSMRRCSRARESRDITVPAGTPSTAAASL